VTASTLSQGYGHTARLFIYEIPISWLATPSRFLMAFSPISAGAVFDFEAAAMPNWWSGHTVGEPRLTQAHTDSVDSFLLRVALLAAIFLLALLIAYLAH
jgi:hypothetical protein